MTDGLTQLRNAYPKSEFIRSTDPLFRPVSITNAPDGTLLPDGHVHRHHPGRAVRRARTRTCGARSSSTRSTSSTTGAASGASRYEGTAPDRARPQMYSETPAQLVEHLEHPNGWWRDTAQKLLVLQQDKSVVPALQTMARTSTQSAGADPRAVDARGPRRARRRARARADEGPGSEDPHPGAFARARRSTRPATSRSRPTTARWLKDADTDVVIQAMLTMNLHKVPRYAALDPGDDATSSSVRGIKEIGDAAAQAGGSSQRAAAVAGRYRRWPALNLPIDQRRMLQRGESTYRELCFACHGADGKGAPMAGAPDGHDARAAAGRLAARARPSRLHHQGAAARPDRRRRRQDLSGRRDGADGHQHRRVDRRRRELRAQQLRQRARRSSRRSRSPRCARPTTRTHAVDARRARGRRRRCR